MKTFMRKQLLTLSILVAAIALLNSLSSSLAQSAQREYFRVWKLAELPIPAGHSLYYGADAYPGVMGHGDYVIQLEKPLPPGKYRIQVRTFNVPKMEATLGGVRKPVPIVRNVFSDPLDIETKEAASTLTLHIDDPDGNPIVQAVFLTTNLRERMGYDDTIIKDGEAPKGAGQIAPAKAREGNFLENSSFEVGPGHGWGKFWNDQLDTTTAYDGKTSLRIPLIRQNVGSDVGWVYRFENFETKFYRLPPGKYTVSAYMKADRATTARGFFGLMGHPDNPAQSGEGTTLGGNPSITTEWKRFAYTVDVPEAPGNLWAVRFSGEWRTIERGLPYNATLEELLKQDYKDIPKNIWIDALQIERAGGASEYSARGGVEVGVRQDKPGAILYDNEPANVDLLVYNPKKSREMIKVDYRVQNYYDATVKQETLSIPLNGETHLKRVISVPRNKRGIFRLLVSHAKDRDSKDELVYSILPPNRNLKNFYVPGRTGSDTGYHPRTLEILKRANINWMIDKGIGRMEFVQPIKGKFIWIDDELQKALDAKITVLGQLFVNYQPEYIAPYMPPVAERGSGEMQWDPAKKAKFAEIWSEYVTKVVTHYKGKINHWEVTNEPYFYSNPEEHAFMLEVASKAIRKVDPKIHIVGFSSANFGGWFERSVRASQPEWYDGISGHFYETFPQTLRTLGSILETQNKTGWQTEAGPTFPSFHVTLPTYQQLRGLDHHTNPSSQAVRDSFTIGTLQSELRCYGIGRIDHYFHYFTRFGNATPNEPTRRAGSGKEDVEYTGALRPYAVGRSIASYFLDGSKIEGEWRGDPRVTMSLFARNGGKGTVGYVFSADGRLLHMAPKQLASWRVYDWQGNPETIKTRISIDRFPRYFAVDLPPSQVRKMLAGEVVTGQLGLDARLVSGKDGKGSAIQLLLHNELSTTQPVSLTFGGVLGGYVGNSQSATGLQLKAGERRLLELPMLAMPGERSMMVSARAGDTIVNFPLHLSSAEARPGNIETAVLNPFNFNFVRSGNGNRMSDADFTPTFQTSYDADNLYLSATIKDDLMSFAPGKIVAGENDGVKFQIAAQTPQRSASTNPREKLSRVPSASDVEIAVAPTSNTAAIAQVQNAKGATSLPAKMTKIEGGYRLDVSVPWQRLGMAAPKAGDSIAFNATAFDADGKNAEHKTEWPWAGGANFVAEDPTGWGELFLLPAQ